MRDSPGLLIRAAADKDLPSIRDLIESNAGDGQLLSVPVRTIRARIGEFLLAELEGVPVGCGRLHDWGRGVRELCSLSVRADRQGRGIGAALVLSLLEMARARDLVFLGTDKPAFYERFGFVPIPRRRIPIAVWLGKSVSLFDQRPRSWKKLVATKYSFMRLDKP